MLSCHHDQPFGYSQRKHSTHNSLRFVTCKDGEHTQQNSFDASFANPTRGFRAVGIRSIHLIPTAVNNFQFLEQALGHVIALAIAHDVRKSEHKLSNMHPCLDVFEVQ
jgi:hypothetical protein